MSWDNPADYAYTDTHDVRDWGWEFIRRNTEYCNEWDIELAKFVKRHKTGNQSKLRTYKNLFAPDKYETFEIGTTTAKKWELSAYQDPRATQLVTSNSRTLVRETIIGFSGRLPIAFETEPNTLHVIIDLEKPLEPQIEALKAEAKRQQKTIPKRTENIENKKRLWILYLRCLDAHESGIDRHKAIKILFPNETLPVGKWDETLKQAKAMVRNGWRNLMI